MITSIFSRGEANKSDKPMFTEDDIRKLIQSFPPPEPRPGKESLVRSLSGNNLVRSDAVTKRFNSLIQNATGMVFLNSLNHELGVRDVQWILAREDERIFYTRDRTRLLSVGAQKQTLGQLRSALENGGVRLEDVAVENHVTVATVLRIVAALDSSLALEDLEDGKTYSVAFLEKTEGELLDALRDATSVVGLVERFPLVPMAWLEIVALEIIARNGDSVKGAVEKGAFGLRFTPQSMLVQLESELKQAQDAYIRKAVDDLNTTGHCDISSRSRPEILQDSSKNESLDFSQAIQEAFKKEGSEDSVVELEAKDQDEEHVFLIRQDTLSNKITEISRLAQETVAKLWDSRTPGEDVTFNSTTTDALSKQSPTPYLTSAILSNPSSSNLIHQSFQSHLTNLTTTSQAQFSKTIRTQFLAPLHLYTQGAETITDPNLQPRLKEFIHNLFRTDHLPTLQSTLQTQNALPSSKPAARDFEKSLDSAKASKTLEEFHTAVAKMVRKLKVDVPDAEMLARVKLEILEHKVRQMRKMKRASDLLQNFVWAVMAGKAEGLFVSAGRDTSRMVRWCRGVVGEEMGSWIEGVRGRVREGTETGEDVEGMRAEAGRVVEGLRRKMEGVRGEVLVEG